VVDINIMRIYGKVKSEKFEAKKRVKMLQILKEKIRILRNLGKPRRNDIR
jgi:hypothetical protein